MLKDGDGCDPLVMLPVGSWGALGGRGVSCLRSGLLSDLLHFTLFSFNIWSLFKITNTGAPAMTHLLIEHASGPLGGLKASRNQFL